MLGVLTPAPVCVTFGVCLGVLHRKYTKENVPKRERERGRRSPASHTKENQIQVCCVVWVAGACLSASSGNAYLCTAILQARAR